MWNQYFVKFLFFSKVNSTKVCWFGKCPVGICSNCIQNCKQCIEASCCCQVSGRRGSLALQWSRPYMVNTVNYSWLQINWFFQGLFFTLPKSFDKIFLSRSKSNRRLVEQHVVFVIIPTKVYLKAWKKLCSIPLLGFLSRTSLKIELSIFNYLAEIKLKPNTKAIFMLSIFSYPDFLPWFIELLFSQLNINVLHWNIVYV